jgi:hypothetical protein
VRSRRERNSSVCPASTVLFVVTAIGFRRVGVLAKPSRYLYHEAEGNRKISAAAIDYGLVGSIYQCTMRQEIRISLRKNSPSLRVEDVDVYDEARD